MSVPSARCVLQDDRGHGSEAIRSGSDRILSFHCSARWSYQLSSHLVLSGIKVANFMTGISMLQFTAEEKTHFSHSYACIPKSLRP
jgi:hypothetical protein